MPSSSSYQSSASCGRLRLLPLERCGVDGSIAGAGRAAGEQAACRPKSTASWRRMSRRWTHSRSSHRCSGALWLHWPCELVRICDLRLPDREKRLPQPSWLQANGRSPVCVRLCAVRWPDREKRSLQPSWSQAYGRSPVCVRLCLVRLSDREKRSPQPSWSQVYGWSPVCVRLCVVRWLDREKRLPQPSWSQANGRSSVCVRICVVRWLDCVKRLPQPS
ncbi:hypothetical protein Ctob_003017 [Chrysochromulina tobinii]|uniref:Uncharacterized protein n=1 Tax=Chrysochromulina tobinii TaxID=1460289 RepID=A0A0M0JC83_9EUKA|nr:hypothetical protein Ctob_003017 [Chrysochromulina tobinii]|eukprot:KOO24206.1 hypothetical protein Ctob_003017 [Chrysochromulina sp. CCMP291]